MKQTIIAVTSLMLCAVFLLACKDTGTPVAVAQNLDKSLTTLNTILKKLDSVDNSYLANPDIYPTTSSLVPAFAAMPDASQEALENNEDLVVNEQETVNAENVEEPETSVNEEITAEPEEEPFNYAQYIDAEKQKHYKPRYYKNAETTNYDYLNNYINKVQKLYTITSDVVEANTMLENNKRDLMQAVEEIKELNECVKNGTCVPTGQQLDALNNYIQDVKQTINRIKGCNGRINNEINSINRSHNSTITTGVDVVSSNYLRILNHIDTRITYLNNALSTLEQIRYLLLEVQEFFGNDEDVSLEQPVQTEQSGYKNIDTYRPVRNNPNNHINNNVNNTGINNVNNETPLVNNNLNNVTNGVNNNVVNNDLLGVNEVPINNGVVPNTNNNGALRTIDNNHDAFLDTDNHTANMPNGTFQNGIITQNNLNPGVNNGVNGINNGVGVDNLHRSGNVDTYRQNTLINMLNNGTVNNGINTLTVEATNMEQLEVITQEEVISQNVTTEEITANKEEAEEDVQEEVVTEDEVNANTDAEIIENSTETESLNNTNNAETENINNVENTESAESFEEETVA